MRRKEEKSEEDKKDEDTNKKKNEKSKFFHVVRLHFIRAPKAVVEGERGVNAERKREKERDRQRETFIASGGFRRFLSFSLNNEKKKKRDKRKEYERIFNNVGRWRGTRKRKTLRQSTSFQREKEKR